MPAGANLTGLRRATKRAGACSNANFTQIQVSLMTMIAALSSVSVSVDVLTLEAIRRCTLAA